MSAEQGPQPPEPMKQREPREGEEHGLVTATPRTATCACGAVALSLEPLRAIDLIQEHVERQGGHFDN